MLRTIRILVFGTILLSLIPNLSKAATVSLSVRCDAPPTGTGSPPGPASQLTLQVLDYAPEVDCLYQPAPPGTSSSAFAQGGYGDLGLGVPDIMGVTASTMETGGALPTASAELNASLLITISNVSGSGFYMPCLAGFGDIFAQFASVRGYGSPSTPTCNPYVRPTIDAIPFTFGEPQIQQLSLDAYADGDPNSAAYLSGFMVYDSNGNVLPNAVVTLVDMIVPEPRLLFPLAMMLALFCVLRRRRCGSASLSEGNSLNATKVAAESARGISPRAAHVAGWPS